MPSPTYVNRSTQKSIVRGFIEHASPGRIRALAGFTAAWVGFRAMHRLGNVLDDALYPEWEAQKVEQPVFIFANGRSGTTMLHRLLAFDTENFAGYKLYQSIVNAVAYRRQIDAIGNGPLAPVGEKAVDLINETFFSGWQGIHELGIDKEEEDEATFALALETSSISLLNPYIDGYERFGAIDTLSPADRRRFMDYYEARVKKHLYASGGNRRFLNKNVFFPVRSRAMLERFPDARFVYLVRHPYSSLPSWLNMFYEKWKTHSPELSYNSPQAKVLAQMSFTYYRSAMQLIDEMPAKNLHVVMYDDLVADPKKVVENLYDWMELPMSEDYASRLAEATQSQRKYKSNHRYSLEQFGLTKEWIYEQCPEVFARFDFER